MEVIRDMFFGISILNSPYLGCEHYAKVNALPQAWPKQLLPLSWQNLPASFDMLQQLCVIKFVWSLPTTCTFIMLVACGFFSSSLPGQPPGLCAKVWRTVGKKWWIQASRLYVWNCKSWCWTKLWGLKGSTYSSIATMRHRSLSKHAITSRTWEDASVPGGARCFFKWRLWEKEAMMREVYQRSGFKGCWSPLWFQRKTKKRIVDWTASRKSMIVWTVHNIS